MNKYKKNGFTLIELMIASTIGTVILIISFALIGNIYFSQKRLRISQNFYSEARFLLEKTVNIIRENTIDYDRYFEKVGPNNAAGECPFFDSDQGGPNSIVASPYTNDETNRLLYQYPNIFYWNVSGEIYRNLGGVKIDGSPDECAQAFHGTLDELYLINNDRNIRIALKLDNGRIQSSFELGADTNNDGRANSWGFYTKWEQVNSNAPITCNIYSNQEKTLDRRITLIDSEKTCKMAHDFENISAKRLFVDSFSFTPYPDRDPFLNFRNDSVQIHPNVFLFMKVDLDDFESQGFTSQPTITMQTSVSSRIFENTRK